MAKALRSADVRHQVAPYAGSVYQPWGDSPQLRPNDLLPTATTTPLVGLPGGEFMGSVESILQTSSNGASLLTPEALRDHMELLLKIHQLEVKVGSSIWRLEDLCQRAEFPNFPGLHSFEFLLVQLIPCVVITPADCFWDGSKAVAPDASVPIPW